MKLKTMLYDGTVKSAKSVEKISIRKGKNVIEGYHLEIEITGDFGKEEGRNVTFGMPMERERLTPEDIMKQRVIALSELCPTRNGIDTYKTLYVMSGGKIGTYRYRTGISEEEE